MAVLDKVYTQARIGLSRTGTSVSTKDALEFRLAHAFARDAVYSSLNLASLSVEIENVGLHALFLKSLATNRENYLKRPDYGRKLDNKSILKLGDQQHGYDIAIIVSEGLSAIAIEKNFIKVFELLVSMYLKDGLSVGPVCIVEQGRVAVADQIGELIAAKLSVIFIGERPGLSSPDSMGCYLTYQPKLGLTDESRNCVSNIRDNGMSSANAASKLFYLSKEALRKKLSGIHLKDEQGLIV
ncbi:MAG: ethanolamine ammonia-lyase subunit EutC [Bacteroidota bacterium]